jgi:L,D-transpeptidase ErfK/SrfK
MYPDDIQQLFPNIALGTRVQIVNQALKVGWLAETLYLEVHPALEEEQVSPEVRRQQINLILMQATDGQAVRLDEQRIEQALNAQNGVPLAIGYQVE